MKEDELPETIFYKKKSRDKVYWVEHLEERGRLEISFDKKTIFNLWQDYPHKFTPEQKEQFDKENPYWADFFKDRF